MVEGLTIGRYSVPYPVIQGGMGVRVSGARLAGNVALCGGVGLVAAAGLALNSEHYNGKNYFDADRQGLIDELRRAYEIAPEGVIGVNAMVAVSNYDECIAVACEGGVRGHSRYSAVAVGPADCVDGIVAQAADFRR